MTKLGKELKRLDTIVNSELPEKITVYEKDIMYVLKKVDGLNAKIDILTLPSIRLHKDNNWLGLLIRLITRSPFNHVSAKIKDLRNNGLQTIIEALPDKGVVSVSKSTNTVDTSVKVIMTVKDNSESNHLQFDVRRFMNVLDSKKYEYNIFELLKFILPWSIRKSLNLFKINRGYFCSELIVDMLMKQGIIRFIFESNKYCPGDFLPAEDNELYTELNKKFNFYLVVRPKDGGIRLYNITKIF